MATALSFEERQMDTLRQQQLQVTHLIGEAGGVNHSALTHKLDDAMVGRRDMEVTLTDAEGRVLYTSSSVPGGHRIIDARFEVPTGASTIRVLLSLDVNDDDRVLERLARTLIAAALAGAVVIAIGGYTLVQVGLRPVRDLSSQIQALDADTLHQHLDGSAQPDE
ncbi:MAG TPA: two-component sensor histidine kinase, partial [Alicycliphilus sp.]|nr:two-component sensor histidine kinase [Alicycliphilus sp.]